MAATRGRKWMMATYPSDNPDSSQGESTVCIYCGMIFRGDTCPRCGERVRDEAIP
jgi:rubrerythrin